MINRGYLLLFGEYQIYFIECVENIIFFTTAQHELKSDCFNSRDGIYLVLPKILNLLFILYFHRLHAVSYPLKQQVLKMQSDF